jgi:prepilin-type N-terminal cleavage/methylation domain-containing protein
MTDMRPRPLRQSGFTLMEVLIAIGILAIGLVAVAAIFPPAILLQREAFNESIHQQYIRSAEATLQANQLSAARLLEYTDVTVPPAVADRVHALSQVPGEAGAGSYIEEFSILDRSFPTAVNDPSLREAFWVPLFARGPLANDYINDWRLYVFILVPRRGDVFLQPTTAAQAQFYANPEDPVYVPKVVFQELHAAINRPGGGARLVFPDPGGNPGINVGDQVVGDNGVIYRVQDLGVTTTTPSRDFIDVNPGIRNFDNGLDVDAIWYARLPDAGSNRSPVREIRLLSDNVTRLEAID